MLRVVLRTGDASMQKRGPNQPPRRPCQLVVTVLGIITGREDENDTITSSSPCTTAICGKRDTGTLGRPAPGVLRKTSSRLNPERL
jgi:hypothetical protein